MSFTKSLIAAGKTIPFRLIKRGRAGTMGFDNNAGTLYSGTKPTATRPLGIYGATNSIGVYFACDDHYCFAAHIQCFVYDPKTSNVLRRFRSRHGLMNMEDTHAIKRSYAARTLLMVNPEMYHADGSGQVGVYVAKAVRNYLLFKEKDHPVDTKHSGFVLQHLQDPYLLPLEAGHRSGGGGKPAELQLFSEIEEFGEDNDDWTIVVNAREDWEGED